MMARSGGSRQRRARKVPVAVLVSGRGSNLQALIAAAAERDFPAEIRVVISNNPNAGALQRAQAAKIPTVVVSHRDFDSRELFEDGLLEALEPYPVKIVCLAGFMRLLTARFLSAFPTGVLNIHPSLLPAFRGLNAPQQAFDYGVRVTGCTVHYVTEGMDEGPIIAQAAVPVYGDDSEETLTARVLAEEHRLYPLALKWVAEGRCHLQGRRVNVEEPEVG